MKKIIPIAFIMLFVCSCASFYQTFQAENTDFINFKLGSKISYSYSEKVLKQKRNRKYARKYYFKGIKMYMVKIQNNTDQSISCNKDLIFTMNGEEVYPLDTDILVKDIKQALWSYSLYSLIGIPVNNGYLPIGACIGLGNAIVAYKSNKKHHKNIAEVNLVHTIIPPNQTVHGIIAFKYNLKQIKEFEILVRE